MIVLTSKRPQAVRITTAQRRRRRLVKAAFGTTLRFAAAVVGAALAYLFLVSVMAADALLI